MRCWENAPCQQTLQSCESLESVINVLWDTSKWGERGECKFTLTFSYFWAQKLRVLLVLLRIKSHFKKPVELLTASRFLNRMVSSSQAFFFFFFFSVNLTVSKSQGTLMAFLRAWTVMKRPLIEKQPDPVRAKICLQQKPVHCLVWSTKAECWDNWKEPLQPLAVDFRV